MARLRRLAARLRALWDGEGVRREIDEELRFHIEMRARENVERGMPPDEARREAERRFGNAARVRDASWDVRGGGWLADFWQDVRYGARVLRKRPGFSFVASLTLALGIGASTAVFSVVNGVLLRPLPYPAPDQLDLLYQQNASMSRFGISAADFQGIEQAYASAEAVAAFSRRSVTLTGGERPEQIKATFVTAGFFKALGVAPAHGRAFVAGEDRPEAQPAVVVSHAFWQTRLAGRPEAVGERVVLDAVSHTVVGVMPSDFVSAEGKSPDLWPILQLQTPRRRGPFTLNVVARRKAGVSPQQGQEELRAAARAVHERWAHTFPDASATYVSKPLKQAIVGDVGTTLLVLLGAVGCVLLLASVNVANLLLARATTRQQEIAVRAALGAGRFRLLRQLFAESVLLALVGGVGGVLLAVWGVDLLLALSPANIPRLDQVGVDGRVLGFAALGTIISCLVFGLVPALYSVGPDLGGPLKGGGRGGAEVPGRRRLRDLLVVFEFALALPLLVGAGLMINSFLRLQQVRPGFDTDRLLTMRLPLPAQKYKENEQALNFHAEMLRRVRSLPGVRAASVTSNLPLDSSIDSNNVEMETHPTPPGQSTDVAENMLVSPDYLRTLGVPLLRGRHLSDDDRTDAPPVAVVSDALARRYYPDGDAVGRRMKTGGCSDCPWTTIVGVVADVRDRGLAVESAPAMYLPVVQDAFAVRSMYLVVRADSDPLAMVASMRREINAVDPDLAVAEVRTMDQLLSESLGQPRYRGVLLGVFAAVALVLAAAGIYGVVAYAVTQRTREIGIRIALGATRRDIFAMIVGRGMLLCLVGVAAGAAAALALTRYLAGLLYGVSGTDPATFGAVVLLLLAVALLACSLPARLATRVDPMIALRQE